MREEGMAMHKRTAERMARQGTRKKGAHGRGTQCRATAKRCTTCDRDETSTRRQPVTSTLVTLIGGALLKGFIVPMLSRFASRVPIGGIAQCVRALWARMLDRSGMS